MTRSRGRGSRRCSSSSTFATGRRIASVATRTACGSGWESPLRCSEVHDSSSSTSRPPASTRPACATCGTSCVASQPTGSRSSSRVISSTRWRSSATGWRSSARAGSSTRALCTISSRQRPSPTACAPSSPSARQPRCSHSLESTRSSRATVSFVSRLTRMPWRRSRSRSAVPASPSPRSCPSGRASRSCSSA